MLTQEQTCTSNRPTLFVLIFLLPGFFVSDNYNIICCFISIIVGLGGEVGAALKASLYVVKIFQNNLKQDRNH